jgi:hypothetical protein
MMTMTEKYYVTTPGEPEHEVSKQEYCDAERSAGFHLGHGPDDPTVPATGSFSGYNGVRGYIRYIWDGQDD